LVSVSAEEEDIVTGNCNKVASFIFKLIEDPNGMYLSVIIFLPTWIFEKFGA
jgi:hypothetical protein